MAVEARRVNLLPPLILGNREFMMNGVEGIGNVYGTPTGYGIMAPVSGTAAAAMETVVPMYGSAITQTGPAKTAAIKSDSGPTCGVPASRKRSRNALNSMVSSIPNGVQNQSANNRCGSFTFLGEDITFHFLQQQLEIDSFIAQHTEKVRMEIEGRRKIYARIIAAAVEENIVKKLKAKQEEIDKIGKLNWALEERVKSLCLENQILKDLAQTNEATANALRCNLEQVLARVQDEQQQRQDQRHRDDEAALADDAQSCCGSNDEGMGRGTLAESHDADYNSKINDECIGPNNKNRMCRCCGKEEPCVLLLPCRHLCLCTVCGSSLHTCPVCNSAKTASVHVNLSAS